LDIVSGTVTRLGDEVSVNAAIAWSPDGQRIALVTGQNPDDTRVVIFNRNGDVIAAFNPPHLLFGSRVGWVDVPR
jgi:hypothetical protein